MSNGVNKRLSGCRANRKYDAGDRRRRWRLGRWWWGWRCGVYGRKQLWPHLIVPPPALSLFFSLLAGSQAEIGKECPVSKPQVTSEHGNIWQVFPVAIKMYVKYVNRGSARAFKNLFWAHAYTTCLQRKRKTHTHTLQAARQKFWSGIHHSKKKKKKNQSVMNCSAATQAPPCD